MKSFRGGESNLRHKSRVLFLFIACPEGCRAPAATPRGTAFPEGPTTEGAGCRSGPVQAGQHAPWPRAAGPSRPQAGSKRRWMSAETCQPAGSTAETQPQQRPGVGGKEGSSGKAPGNKRPAASERSRFSRNQRTRRLAGYVAKAPPSPALCKILLGETGLRSGEGRLSRGEGLRGRNETPRHGTIEQFNYLK